MTGLPVDANRSHSMNLLNHSSSAPVVKSFLGTRCRGVQARHVREGLRVSWLGDRGGGLGECAGVQTIFKERTDCMKEAQNGIFYLTSESIAAASSSPSCT